MGCCSCPTLTVGMLKTGATTLLLIFNYYIFSISLTFYNKKVVMRFSYPLIMTYIHLLVKFSLAGCVRKLLECRRGKPRVTLGWFEYVTKIAPVGITSILDIALSNWSFEYITVSLYTMTKTSSIVFLLIFAILLKVEKFRWLQLCVVISISIGLFLFTFESTQFNLTGFLMCLFASGLSGLRWSLTQLVAQKDELGVGHPVDFMYHVQPWMLLGLLPIAMPVEGLKFVGDHNFLNYHSSQTFAENMGLLLVGAVLAFGLEFGEFLLVRKTSSLTLSVSAMFKECAVLFIAHWANGDEMNYINLLGLTSCLLGVALHVYLKANKASDQPTVQDLNGDTFTLLPTSELNQDAPDPDVQETVT